MVKNLSLGQKIKILQDDSSVLTFEIPQTGPQAYSVLTARLTKNYYCWVLPGSAAQDARAKLAADFEKIGDSIKGVAVKMGKIIEEVRSENTEYMDSLAGDRDILPVAAVA